MFEAKIAQGAVLKKILDALKDLVSEATWDCNSNGMSLQAMDTSHVSLVAIQLKADGFDKYRCDRNVTLGMNLQSLSKVLKCAGNEDELTLKAQDDGDKISIMFESKDESECHEYELKLMSLDSEYLGIPDTPYAVTIKLPSTKFQRICRDLGQIGDSVTISCAKDGVRFAATGDIGSGSVRLSNNSNADKEDETVSIDMQEPIVQAFALKYLNHISKATPLATQVSLSMSPDVPLVVEYQIKSEDCEKFGYVRYYLAPKIDEGDE